LHNRPKKPKNAVNNFVNKKQLDKPQNISVFKSLPSPSVYEIGFTAGISLSSQMRIIYSFYIGIVRTTIILNISDKTSRAI